MLHIRVVELGNNTKISYLQLRYTVKVQGIGYIMWEIVNLGIARKVIYDSWRREQFKIAYIIVRLHRQRWHDITVCKFREHD